MHASRECAGKRAAKGSECKGRGFTTKTPRHKGGTKKRGFSTPRHGPTEAGVAKGRGKHQRAKSGYQNRIALRSIQVFRSSDFEPVCIVREWYKQPFGLCGPQSSPDHFLPPPHPPHRFHGATQGGTPCPLATIHDHPGRLPWAGIWRPCRAQKQKSMSLYGWVCFSGVGTRRGESQGAR